MKTLKILLPLALVAIGICSCTKMTNGERNAHLQRQDNDRITRGFKRVTFEGHTYIFYESQSTRHVAMTHDPDCECDNIPECEQ